MRSMTIFTHNGTDYKINDPNIADEFDATASYAAGDTVFYGGDLYVFTSPHSGAWTGTDAETMKVGEAFQDLKEETNAAISEFEQETNAQISDVMGAAHANMPNLLSDVTWTDGYYLTEDGIPGTNANMMYSSAIPITHPLSYKFIYKAVTQKMTTRLHGYKNSDTPSASNWVRQLRAQEYSAVTLNTEYTMQYDAVDCDYVRISVSKAYINLYLGQTIEDEIFCGDQQNDIDILSRSNRLNLLGGVDWTKHQYIDEDGTVKSDSLYLQYSDLIPVRPGRNYQLAFGVKSNRTPMVIRVHGYNSSGTWQKQLLEIPASYQTAGENGVMTFNTEGYPQIRISAGIAYFLSLSGMEESIEATEEGLLKKSFCTFETGGINYDTGDNNSSSSTTRIRTPGYADLSAEFIRGENLEIALYLYNRDHNETDFSHEADTFIGTWDGNKPVKGTTVWFQTINVRAVYESLNGSYPNLLYRVVARRPGGNVSAADGALIPFYTRSDLMIYATVGSYENWAVCGASYDSGYYSGVEHYWQSWPQVLARRSGNTCVNYSYAGAYLKTFLANTSVHGFSQMLADTAKELYVLTFGGNDATHTSDQPIGTIADIKSDYTQNPNSFYGNYGKLLDQLIAHAPNAKIILTTPSSAGGGWYSANQLKVDNAIRAIAAKYEIPCIEWESDDFMRSNLFLKHIVSSHPVKINYGGMAMAFERLFSRCVIENAGYFE